MFYQSWCIINIYIIKSLISQLEKLLSKRFVQHTKRERQRERESCLLTHPLGYGAMTEITTFQLMERVGDWKTFWASFIVLVCQKVVDERRLLLLFNFLAPFFCAGRHSVFHRGPDQHFTKQSSWKIDLDLRYLQLVRLYFYSTADAGLSFFICGGEGGEGGGSFVCMCACVCVSVLW